MISKQQIKNIVALHQKKSRRNEKLFLVEGEKTVTDLLLSDWKVRMICTTDIISGDLRKLLEDKFKGEHLEISSDDMDKISPQMAPQGVLAVVHNRDFRFDITELKGQLTLVLDDIQDPGNLGTIIRLADWFGIKHIVCSEKTTECYNPKVVQASMGSLFRAAMYYMDLEELFKLNKETIRLPIYGTLMDGENIFSSELKKSAFLLLGNEANGIRMETRAFISNAISIPSYYDKSSIGPDSLNVAIAAGIVCAEFRRRDLVGGGIGKASIQH